MYSWVQWLQIFYKSIVREERNGREEEGTKVDGSVYNNE